MTNERSVYILKVLSGYDILGCVNFPISTSFSQVGQHKVYV